MERFSEERVIKSQTSGYNKSLVVVDNGRWIITKVSVDDYITMGKWINHIDYKNEWDFRNKEGVYILYGIKNDQPTYYIGVATNWKNRWPDHKNKKGWATSIIYITGNLTKSKDDRECLEAQLIENFSQQQLKKKFILDNKTNGYLPTSESNKSYSIKMALENTIIPLLDRIDVPVKGFKKYKKITLKTTSIQTPILNKEDPIPISYSFDNKKFKGIFHFDRKGCVTLLKNQIVNIKVLSTSKGQRIRFQSLQSKVKEYEELKLVKIQKIDDQTLDYTILEDIENLPASKAAFLVRGFGVNGWICWLCDDGSPIKKYQHIIKNLNQKIEKPIEKPNPNKQEKPKLVSVEKLIELDFFKEGELFYDKKNQAKATLLKNGFLKDGEESLSIHKMGGKTLNLPSGVTNGWVFWQVMRDGELVPISEIRDKYRKQN